MKGGQAWLVSGIVVVGMGGLVLAAARSVLVVETSSSPPGPLVKTAAEAAEDKLDALRQRGAYLWSALDCNACHTPRDQKGQPIASMQMAGHPEGAPLPEWDPSLLSKNVLMTMDPTGTAFAGPWGVSVAPNLTPDKESGIGRMTADQLISSWRSGRHWQQPREILPPMPAPAYATLTDDDIRAVHAFLMSLPPHKNKASASQVAPPPR